MFRYGNFLDICWESSLAPLVPWLEETGLPTTTGDGVFLTLEDLSPLDVGLLSVTPELLSLAATLDNDPDDIMEDDEGLGVDIGVVFTEGREGCLTPDVNMGLVLVPVKLITLETVFLAAPTLAVCCLALN